MRTLPTYVSLISWLEKYWHVCVTAISNDDGANGRHAISFRFHAFRSPIRDRELKVCWL